MESSHICKGDRKDHESRKRMRLAIYAVGAMLLFAIPSAAQKPGAKNDDVTIKAYTKLVQVPAVVTDKSGRPVEGLTKDDFVVYEDGKEVKISTFQSAEAPRSAAPSASAKPTPGVYANLQAGKPVERPIVILLIDALNTAFLDQAQARLQLIKFLREKVEPGTMLSLMVLSKSGVHVIHEYTTDPAVLMEALRRTKDTSAAPVAQAAPTQDKPPTQPFGASLEQPRNTEGALVPFNQAEEEAALLNDFIVGGTEFEGLRRANYTDLVMRSLRTIAEHLSGVPGRKALVWVASNFPYFKDDFTSINSTDPRARYVQTFELLNDANVAVYPLDARGLLGYAASALTFGAGAYRGSRQTLNGGGDTGLGDINAIPDPIDTMKTVAELTGGLPFYGTNDLSGAMKKATNDASGYYMLGYYLPGGAEAKPGKRKVKVEVKKPGLNVRSRTRVYVTPGSLSPAEEIAGALRSPLEFTGLPLTVTFDWAKARSSSEGFAVSLDPKEIAITEPEKSISLSYVAEARSKEGKVLDRTDQTLAGRVDSLADFLAQPFGYTNKLRPLGEAATVRFVVRDNNSGRMGSVIVMAPPLTLK